MVHVLTPKFFGSPDVADIIEAVEFRLALHLKNRARYTEAEFLALPRDPEGNIIGYAHTAYYNRFTEDQFKRISQFDKDTIRDHLQIQMRRMK